MEEIYANAERIKSVNPRPSTNQTGPSSSERTFHGVVILSLGLLSVSLLAGLIGLGVHHYNSVQRSAAELSSVRANLTDRQATDDKISFLTEERDQLNASLIKMTEELVRLQTLSKQMKCCPDDWSLFNAACYFLSRNTGPWENGRMDCRARGADLVVIDSLEKQMFMSNFTKRKTQAWIGLTDEAHEGTWIWIDGSQLTLMYWREGQPDNKGDNKPENCAHIITGEKNLNNWNDLPCENNLSWICEKKD
ncbi:CD209 antigen-like protein C isoform X2 [Lates calcarifer]|uniref:CD209 antigen-like protein C isoform X2 n=1 Tax=Lates calcarifer TaxID=8187 RepID=A0AAJ7L9M4_LATCA|nr:CD209 antigen-like protein C isoform X2 [Lates calcarifer]